jgi:Family of unknown function (DUF6444)
VAGFDGFSERELRGICYAQAELLARQAGQLAEQAEQLAQLAQLRDEVVGLRAEVDRLRRRLSRHSGNSSMPPSTDGVLRPVGGAAGSPARPDRRCRGRPRTG